MRVKGLPGAAAVLKLLVADGAAEVEQEAALLQDTGEREEGSGEGRRRAF